MISKLSQILLMSWVRPANLCLILFTICTQSALSAEPNNPEPSNAQATPATSKDTAQNTDTIKTESVEIKGKKLRIITPLPGLSIDRSTSTTNIQSATGKEIAESKAIGVTDFMNSEMQSVTVSDYSGNPFQQDLNFRGFTASPAIGTPQGISVYMDGVRINEAFGDVVNWDLIPMNAIQSLDLISGSNPMFGLNTLGGALAIKTKNGFTDEHERIQVLAGDWGRQQVQVSNGFNNGTFGFFTAYNHFNEDGWRKSSPSSLRQIFNNATVRLDRVEINFSVLNVDTDLVGNGMLPYETASIPSLRDSVYTAPDESTTSMAHYNLNVRWDITDNASLSFLAYRRNLNQTAVGADIYDTYYKLFNIDPTTVFNGVFNNSSLQQVSQGAAIQFAIDLEKHQIVSGITYDTNRVSFGQTQQLGAFDDNHVLHYVTDPNLLSNCCLSASIPVVRNSLTGGSHTTSLFANDTWSPTDRLHISYGGRFNWTNVVNFLKSDSGIDLYNFTNNNLLLPDRCKVTGNGASARFFCSTGDFNYFSFNPAIGFSWEILDNLTTYANISRGARTPTTIELGCARDHTKDNAPAGSTNYQYGCSIPTALTSDPYLKQVRSTAYETGVRGSNFGFDWNFGLFRTELKDDILFVPLGNKNRGVFDNFGHTLRQGIEMGMKGVIGKSTLGINYTWMRATFESDSLLINDANSENLAGTTDASGNIIGQAFVNLKAGSQIPGMPNHIVQANWNYRFNDRFDTTLSMIAHSSSYVRGDENNEYEARAARNVGTNHLDPFDYIGFGKISGYAMFNLRANYRFDEGISIFVKIDNLLDKDYATAGALGRNAFTPDGTFKGSNGGMDWQNTTFIGPGAPRAIWAGLNFDLDWKKFKDQQK